MVGLEVYYWFILFEVDVLIGTEVFGKGNAGEVLAPGAVVDGGVVEDHDKDTENEEHTGEAEDD